MGTSTPRSASNSSGDGHGTEELAIESLSDEMQGEIRNAQIISRPLRSTSYIDIQHHTANTPQDSGYVRHGGRARTVSRGYALRPRKAKEATRLLGIGDSEYLGGDRGGHGAAGGTATK